MFNGEWLVMLLAILWQRKTDFMITKPYIIKHSSSLISNINQTSNL